MKGRRERGKKEKKALAEREPCMSFFSIHISEESANKGVVGKALLAIQQCGYLQKAKTKVQQGEDRWKAGRNGTL